MGVPAFFRWLSRKYPSIIVNCVEEKPKECNGVKIPVDTSKPNPNEVEYFIPLMDHTSHQEIFVLEQL
uniref:5'-3' exoribonuclease 2 n=1 Tax=Vombatus ursinus TaxID=29139 RepID=A0A4X2KDA0_VOMUR